MKGFIRFIIIFLLMLLSVTDTYAQPVWVIGTPSVASTGPFSITLNYGINVTGIVYIIVYNYNNTTIYSSSAIRTRAQKPPSGSVVATASISVSKVNIGKILQVVLNVNDPNQIHTVYIVADDSKGVLQASPVRLNATTLPCPKANAGSGGNECDRNFILNAVPVIGTGIWTRVSGPGTASFAPNASSPDATVTVTAYGTYVFRWTESQGVCKSSGDITVNFYQPPVANAGGGGDECDLNFVLNAVPGTGTGTWTKAGGPGNATFSPSANQYNATVTVTQSGSYDFAWTEVKNNCTSVDIIRVVFHAPPSVNAGPDAAVCKGSSIRLQAGGVGTFLWSPANLLNNPAIPDPVATPAGTTVFTVTLTDQWKCRNSDQVTIEVREKPVVNAGQDQILDFLFETTLEATSLKSHETGEWDVLTGTGNFSDRYNNKTKISELAFGENNIRWSVTNGVCAPSSDTVLVKIRELIIQSLLTPNGDGSNDFFIIRGLESLGKTRLYILNRWGAIVYDNDNYSNNWDGRDNNGNILQNDTYFYVLKPEKLTTIKGYIVIKN
jgi:gliding motility-associated-like protein